MELSVKLPAELPVEFSVEQYMQRQSRRSGRWDPFEGGGSASLVRVRLHRAGCVEDEDESHTLRCLRLPGCCGHPLGLYARQTWEPQLEHLNQCGRVAVPPPSWPY